jgi:hypothetical protein
MGEKLTKLLELYSEDMQGEFEFRQTKCFLLASRMKRVLKDTQSWIPCQTAPLVVAVEISSLQIVRPNGEVHLRALKLSSALETATG